MKVVIVAVNSKYVHTMLAPRYLKANCIGKDVEIFETNVNVPVYNTVVDVYLKKPDVVALSVYIFNESYVRRFISELKKVMPNVKIVLGGWEVAFNEQNYLPLADYILKGEGDFAFNNLLDDLQNCKDLPKIIECGTVEDLSQIKSPYEEDYAVLGKEKILYFETSRGCPYSCGYCMSSTTKRVRYFPLDRVFEDLKKVTRYNPKFLKFTDRTFNCNKKRATEILNHIVDNYSESGVCFHFEMSPELFDDEMISVVKRAKKGLFQFEIGVQSYNEQTLKAVNRHTKSDVVDANLRKIIDCKNTHVHVDLIAGLPHEDRQSFVCGFNRLIGLKPNELQLGFLKILKGSWMAKNSEGYSVSEYSPYEIYSSPELSFEDVIELKNVNTVLEIYYNSGKFKNSLAYLIDGCEDVYGIFLSLYNFSVEKGCVLNNLSFNGKCDLLFLFGENIFSKNGNSERLLDFERLIEQDFEEAGNNRKWRKVR